MDQILKVLGDIQPLLLLASLLIFWTIESFVPYFNTPKRMKHTGRNLVLLLSTLLINVISGSVFILAVSWANEHHFGILQWIPLPFVLQIILGMFALDFGSYVLHIITHKIPLLWRYHRVHHSDIHVDSTTGGRFHPFEIVMQNFWQAGFQILTGMPLASAIIYYTLFLPWLIAEHANVKFPHWFEKYASWLIVTPGWHKVHHSQFRPQTDSHYGDFFTIWDRLFGTYHKVNVDEIEYGIEQFRNEDELNLLKQMAMPFEKLDSQN